MQASSKVTSAAPSSAVPWHRYAVYFSIAVVGCLVDLLTKAWVFEWRGVPRAGNVWWLVKGYVGIETSLNEGALFGMGAGYGLVFAGLSVVAAVGILYWLFIAGAAHDLWLTIALGAVSGGIFGNLYDRLGLWNHPDGNWHGEVRDWILLCYGQHTWPNFNIADSLLVCGAAMLVCHAFFAKDPAKKK